MTPEHAAREQAAQDWATYETALGTLRSFQQRRDELQGSTAAQRGRVLGLWQGPQPASPVPVLSVEEAEKQLALHLRALSAIEEELDKALSEREELQALIHRDGDVGSELVRALAKMPPEVAKADDLLATLDIGSIKVASDAYTRMIRRAEKARDRDDDEEKRLVAEHAAQRSHQRRRALLLATGAIACAAALSGLVWLRADHVRDATNLDSLARAEKASNAGDAPIALKALGELAEDWDAMSATERERAGKVCETVLGQSLVRQLAAADFGAALKLVKSPPVPCNREPHRGLLDRFNGAVITAGTQPKDDAHAAAMRFVRNDLATSGAHTDVIDAWLSGVVPAIGGRLNASGREGVAWQTGMIFKDDNGAAVKILNADWAPPDSLTLTTEWSAYEKASDVPVGCEATLVVDGKRNAGKDAQAPCKAQIDSGETATRSYAFNVALEPLLAGPVQLDVGFKGLTVAVSCSLPGYVPPAKAPPTVAPPALAAEDVNFVDRRRGQGWDSLCYKHVLVNEFNAARAACQKALDSDPTPATKGSIYFNLGLIGERTENNEVAFRYYTESLAARPNGSSANIVRQHLAKVTPH